MILPFIYNNIHFCKNSNKFRQIFIFNISKISGNIFQKYLKKYNTYFQYYKILLNKCRKPKPHPALIDF